MQISGSQADTEELARRFDRAPKPMYYPADFLARSWADYIAEKGIAEDRVDPDDFIRWGFGQLCTHRVPRYAAIAAKWGITVDASDVAQVRTPGDFHDLIAAALEARTGS